MKKEISYAPQYTDYNKVSHRFKNNIREIILEQ